MAEVGGFGLRVADFGLRGRLVCDTDQKAPVAESVPRTRAIGIITSPCDSEGGPANPRRF